MLLNILTLLILCAQIGGDQAGVGARGITMTLEICVKGHARAI